jgi:hypothetical protein
MNGSRGMSQQIGGRNVERFQSYTPEQMQLFQDQFQHVGPGSYLSRLASGDQSLFAQQEAGAKQQFGEQQGDIASRFSGMGMGARRGSGFQNSQNQASSDFASRLQSNRMDLQRNAIKDLMGMSNELLGQRPYEDYAVTPDEETPWWQSILGEALPIAAGAAGTFFGGPMAGAAAYQGTKGVANTIGGSKSGAGVFG